MSKFSIATATYFGEAILNLLDDNGYEVSDKTYAYGDGDKEFILVNTDKKTYRDSDTDKGRTVYNPTTQWAEIVAALDGAAAPAAPVVAAPAFAVGDQVTAHNFPNTKAKFRLQDTPPHVYTIDRITASGKIGLAGLPNDEYLQKRFTKIDTRAQAAASAIFPQASATTTVQAVDVNGASLRVGDTVLVVAPTRRDGRFSLAANGVETISVITAKGNIGFGGADQYLGKRFQKVTLSDAAPRSGDLVVAVRDGKHKRYTNNISKFALPKNVAFTFRGLTVDKGNYILDGYTEHQYSPARFKTVVK